MRILKSAMVMGTTAAMVIGLAGPAAASKDTVVDVRGDAKASLDITKVTFRHPDAGVRAKVHVRNLRNRGEFVLGVANRSNSLRYGLAATGHKNGSVTKRFYRFRDGDLKRTSCRKASVGWHPKKDT
ncbi:MAG: hypothetical protein ACRDO7_02930, partial [Nocardioidaceae bacterium]